MSGRPRGSGQRTGIPVCQRHPTSHVVLHGKYGKEGARRQLYLCQPNVGASHTFAGALARKMLEHGAECDTCETHLETHQGPPTPARFVFTVREAASALAEVARGGSYSGAALNARMSAQQFGAEGRKPQLAANWVETLTPLATSTLTEKSWPQTIVCDSTSFQYTDNELGTKHQAFAVLAVWGYEAGQTKGRLWALRASHLAKVQDWVDLFDLLPGVPDLVVCDGISSIPKAVAQKWPPLATRPNWSQPTSEPFILRCEYHLRKNALDYLVARNLHYDEKVMNLLDHAFESPQGWDAFRKSVANYTAVTRWCTKNDARIRAQTTMRPNLPPHHSNGAVEAAIIAAKAAIGTRQAVLRNKFRTNQMLELVRADINHRADPVVFARSLRTSLEAGVLTEHQLTCVDVGTRTRRVKGRLVTARVKSSLRQ